MFLYRKKCLMDRRGSIKFHFTNLKIKKLLKRANLSPPEANVQKQDAGTFFFAPLRAALTVEAAIVLPLFLMVMVAVLQYGSVMGTAARFGASLTETGKQMAIAAYLTKYGGDATQATGIAGVALSEIYAQSKVMSQTGDTSSVKNANMLLSSFLKNDETIDLVLTYQLKSPFSIVKLPSTFFLQRARIRAWTGRVPSEDGSSDGDDTENTYVYVTATGSVYHDDPDCTHLRLSIRQVDAESLTTLRNSGGGKYYACEKCGASSAGGSIYITNDGDCYHSSVNCSGLKRTVRQITKEEASSLKACSRCGK